MEICAVGAGRAAANCRRRGALSVLFPYQQRCVIKAGPL